MTAICDKLFDFDANQAIIPVLATGYEWVDGITLLIRLRPGVQFHNGEPFDAAAVKYTLDRHATTPGSFRRNEIGAMERVEVMDPLTVRVVLKRPFSPFVAVLTDRAGMMVAPKAAEAAGKEFGLNPVCAGPFRFIERVAQDRVVLERFPGYWDAGRIHYHRVTYRVVSDSSIRLANLRAGALDIAEVAPLDVQAAKADPKLAVVSVPSLGYGALTVNLAGKSPIALDPRVRRAFQLSLDRVALSQVVFAGMYEPNAQAISAASPFHAPAVPMPPHDLAAAGALLQQAGVAAPLRVELLVSNTPQIPCCPSNKISAVPQLGRQRGTAATPPACVQPCQPHAHPGIARPGDAVVTHDGAGQAGQDRCQGGPPWPHVSFQLAEVTVPRQLFGVVHSLIARLRTPPTPA